MASIHPRRVVIDGKYWTLTTAPLRGLDGLAENDPTTPKKHIWISDKAKGLDLLDTIIHEVTHCSEKKWMEEAVLRFSSDLAKILWDLGYRSTELGDED
jgi:hypothetical protein